MAQQPKSGSKSKPAAAISGFGRADAKSKAAVEAFGKGLASLDFDGDLEVGLGDEVEAAPEPAAEPESAGDSFGVANPGVAEFELEPEPEAQAPLEIDTAPTTKFEVSPNLEPVSDDAHPPQNRRAPTQPPGALQLALDERAPTQRHERVPSAEPTKPSSSTKAPSMPSTRSPSPSPVRGRRWLFSDDRVTNLLAGAAIGLALMIFPAKKLARGYEVSEVEPLLADLDGAIDHPLGVEAGLVEKPEAIAAKIEAGRKSTRHRYLGIWLLVGLPLGLGLGLAPRPGD